LSVLKVIIHVQYIVLSIHMRNCVEVMWSFVVVVVVVEKCE